MLDSNFFGVTGECQREAGPACCSVVVRCRPVLEAAALDMVFLELLGSVSVRLDLPAAQLSCAVALSWKWRRWT